MRRSIAGLLLGGALVLGGVACSGSQDRSGATTDLSEVGPQIAKLRLEVQSLRQEVLSLRQQVALLTSASDSTTTTTPLR